MHGSVLAWGQERLAEIEVEGKLVLECGSLDVNGSLRPFVIERGPLVYHGIDKEFGPGVDAILGTENIVAHYGAARWDLIISTEMLEHASRWQQCIHAMKEALAPGGTLLLTTRSPGFPYHGYPEDHWRFTPETMEEAFADAGEFSVISDPDPDSPGVFVLARGPFAPGRADPVYRVRAVAMERPA
jgi:SAM-dependent methyltransferase